MTILSILAALALFTILSITVWRSAGSKNAPAESLFCADSDSLNGPGARDPDFSRKILSRVFSDEDRTFLAGLGSEQLRSALLAERKRIAIRWIHSNAAEAGRIVRAHMQMAAKAGDLRVTGEAALASRYLELLVVCYFLTVLVLCFGPGKLSGLAGQAEILMATLRAFRNGGTEPHASVVSG